MKETLDWYKEKREVFYKMEELRKLVETEERTMSPEEHATWNEMNERLDEIQKHIDVQEKMKAMRGSLLEPVSKSEPTESVEERVVNYRNALRSWLRGGTSNLKPQERDILKGSLGVHGNADSLELRAPGAVANPSYVQAIDVMREIEEAKKYYGGWMGACDEFRTAKGNLMYWPTVDDTARTGAIEAVGTDAFDSSDAVTLGRKQLESYIYSSQGVVIGNSELEDADFDMGKALGEVLGTRLWRAISTVLTTGDGSSKPQGLARAAAVGVLAGSGTITRARILQLIGRVDYAYHLSPSAGLMLHSSMMYEIAGVGVGSADFRPLWQPSMAAGVPDKIEGFPYWVNNDMTAATTTGANTRHILFGDFKKFKIRYAGPVMLVRLVERYAAELQTGFIAIQRVDSELIAANATTYNPVKYLRKLST
jgi:HK97 family phage major capsid protein